MNSLIQKSMSLEDHRELNNALELFYSSEELGQGLPIWLPNGAAVRWEIEKFLRESEDQGGYRPVVSPQIAPEELYVKSGHLPYYEASMFGRVEAPSGERYRLRPMNCPHHHLVFASKPRSYRDLPLRLAEFGQVFRYENSGSLQGLIRARCLCINDAHIYVARAELSREISQVLAFHLKIFAKLGIRNFRLRLSKWDSQNPKGKFVDDVEQWNFSQDVLRSSLKASGLEFFEAPGEAAFYGPKIDFQARSASGREESLSSIQLDFASARHFGLEFRNRDNQLEQPYVLHRAPIGSFERMVAFLLELHQGHLPFWLAPVQIKILLLDAAYSSSAKELAERLQKAGGRIRLDEDSGSSISKRIKDAIRRKIPVVLLWGKNEVRSGYIAGKIWNSELRRYEELRLSGEALSASMSEALQKRHDAVKVR